MTQQNLLELAKQGDSKAIACLLRPKLKAQGIAVKADIKKDCLIVFLESDEVPDEQASVEFIKKEVEKLGVAFLHVVKVYARQKGEYHPTWVKEFEIAAQVETPLPPGCSLLKANSKDKIKMLKLELFLLTLRSLFVWLGVTNLVTVSLFLLLNLLFNYRANWFILMLNTQVFIVIIFVSLIIEILFMDISNSWFVECDKQLVGYGILNCFREDRKVGKRFSWLNVLSILGRFIMTLVILFCFFVVNGIGVIFYLILFKEMDNLGSFEIIDYLGIFSFIGIVVVVNYSLIRMGIDIFSLNPHKKLDRTEKKSSIQALFVAPAWRRRGLGSALVRRLIQEAPLPLYVDSLPERVSFYTRLGFVPLRTKSSPFSIVTLVYNIDSGVSSTKRRIN